VTKFCACSKNNKGKQKRRNKLENEDINNLQAKRAENVFLTVVRRIVTLRLL